MKQWVNYMRDQSKDYLWQSGFHFGDWLFYRPDDDNSGRAAVTDKYLIAQCFFAHSTQYLINAAQALDKTEDVTEYTELLGHVKDAYQREYLTPSGRLVSGTQTAYVLALHFDMLPEALREQAADRLVANIRDYDTHLTTGFLGTPYLCHVLSRFGHSDVAYELLMQKTYPSWLYPVTMGATTIWERWDGIKPDSTFQTPSMNSYNHYAYGAIGDWMYRNIAGLNASEEGVAYKQSVIKPLLGGDLTEGGGELMTDYGKLASHWQTEDTGLLLDVTIPVNTTADVYVPAASADGVTEGGKALADVQEIEVVGQEGNYLHVKTGSGTYRFTSSTINEPVTKANDESNYTTTMKNVFALLVIILPLWTVAQSPDQASDLQVKTAHGILEGTYDSGIRIFRGVPFAQPPVGELRWKAPQPVQRWEGVKKADTFGPRAMQRPIFSDMNFRSDGVSEDCLYLNVWTPANSADERLPVLVYFYGGGFIAGDGSEYRYDGESMARRGIVALTVNYRLNVFGFFAHPELTKESPNQASGNYGLLDQAAALQWVHENIAAFGGDPDKVTIAGESAGSFSVSAQMASPLSKDLIAGAIGESGSLLGSSRTTTLAEAEQAGVQFAKMIDAPSLAALRSLPADSLLKATANPTCLVSRSPSTAISFLNRQTPSTLLVSRPTFHCCWAGIHRKEVTGRCWANESLRQRTTPPR